MRYSLNTEQWTGDYWINGKKIYRQTIYANNPSDGQTIATISNFGRLINQYGTVIVNNERQTSIPFAEQSYGFYIQVDQNGNVKCPYTSNATYTEVYSTVEYTKTGE